MIGWFGDQLADDRLYVEASVERADRMYEITGALIEQWVREREEERRARAERLGVLQASIVGALLMALAAVQALEYRLPLPARLEAPLIAVLSALALTLPTVAIRLSRQAPDPAPLGLAGHIGSALVGASMGWLVESLATCLRHEPPAAVWTMAWAAAGGVAGMFAAALRSWVVRRSGDVAADDGRAP
jgi:hypothetical protein